MRVISPVSLPTYLSVVYRNNMSAVPASIHLKTNVDRIYLLLLKTVLSFPSLLSKTMSIFQDFFKTFLQFSQIQDYFQDLNEFINFKTFSSLEENVRTMYFILTKIQLVTFPIRDFCFFFTEGSVFYRCTTRSSKARLAARHNSSFCP